MKISAAFREAFRVYFGHFGASLKFLVVEGCMTLAAFTPLLFLTEAKMQMLVLLAVPFYMLLVLWARVNAAAAMRDALNGGSLFSYQLADPSGYGRKLLYGLKKALCLILWGGPMIAALVIARIYMSGDTDGFTLMRWIKTFGGGDFTQGVLYLALIFLGTVLLFAVGCAFHSGDRHAYVRENPKLIKGHRGKLMLCWLCALVTLLPIIAAAVVVALRYLPLLKQISLVLSKKVSLPDTKTSVLILGVGAVLTIPLMPLRSLITAAFVNGLQKE